tara:strand:- start:241 stop:795 length:555 start_codon:yes stop_codon:yes gene_type:complete
MFRCLKKFFQKPEVSTKKSNNVILIGHSATKKGARVIGYQNEYKYNSKVGHIVKGLIPEIEVCFYNELEEDYVVISDPGFISLELHCNAFNGYVKGSEVLIMRDDFVSKPYAEDFLEDLCERFKKRNRGVKELDSDDLGYNNLKNVKKKGARIAIIVEPFFGDAFTDVISSTEYAQFLVDWFNN